MGTTRVHRIGMVAIAATTLVFTACTAPVPPGPSAAVDCPRTLTPLVDVDTGEQGILGRVGLSADSRAVAYTVYDGVQETLSLRVAVIPAWAESAFDTSYGPVVMGISGNGSVVPYVRFDNPFGNTYPRSVLRAHRRSMADVVQAPLPPDTAILANLSLSLSVSDDGRWVPVAYGPVAADHTFVPGSLSLWDTTTNTLHDYGTVPQLVPLATDGRFTGTVITADGNAVLFSARWTGLLGATYDGVFRIDRATGLVLPVWTRQVADTSEASGTTVVAFANRGNAVAVGTVTNSVGQMGWIDLATGSLHLIGGDWYPVDMSTDGQAVQLERAVPSGEPFDEGQVRVNDLRHSAVGPSLTSISPQFVPMSGNADMTKVAGVGSGGIWVSSCT